MIDCFCAFPNECRDLIVGLYGFTGVHFVFAVRRHCRRFEYPAPSFEGCNHRSHIFRIAKIIRLNQRIVHRIRAFEANIAAALGQKIADVKRIAITKSDLAAMIFQICGQEVKLNIRPIAVRGRLNEPTAFRNI